jgi:hypothetical protein
MRLLKYAICDEAESKGFYNVEIPQGSQVLKFGLQDGGIYVWVAAEQTVLTALPLWIGWTGQEIPEGYVHRATLIGHDLVHHVFERKS